ncbi:hypothetical protein OG562_25800 [Streptomyces sp. NBC_01275]|uniref:hypothetical protein n=1 Tax=Streptomyces sp. NBC_01275 TaxID=2903807 RepID=UPI002258E85D|nr:hypothetical protein [Streptomyces sp. NBC_01275]MCX4764312.1 hypothetical protein [Streptomyces sp. NBC_01275]
MPQLPEDIIDRLTQMERRIQQLSTAVNSRPALNTITGGEVEIKDGTLKVTDGGTLLVQRPTSTDPMFRVGSWKNAEYGLEIHRQTGSLAMSLFNGDGTATSLQPLRIYDNGPREIISDDVNNGGLARPWLAMLPPQDAVQTRWPQTALTSWTTIAMSLNPVFQPKMRLRLLTGVSSGGAGQVRVLVNSVQWGPTVTAGAEFDYTDLLSSDFNTVFTPSTATLLKVEIQAIATTGTVYATPVLMYGRQT